MADQRLEDIRTSDDHESAVNVELIEWLKTTGINILLVLLLIVIGFRGFLWLKERKQAKIDTAWADYAGTDSAAALESLADRAEGIGSIPELSLLQAANQYHQDILRNETLELLPDEPTMSGTGEDEDEEDETPPLPEFVPMTERERTETLAKMDRLYTRVFDMTTSKPGKTNWKLLLHLQAIFGLAAVAEMSEDWEAAAKWYTLAEETAGSEYAALGAVARAWRENPVKSREVFPSQTTISDALFKPVEPAAGSGGTNADRFDRASNEGVESATEPAQPESTTDDPDADAEKPVSDPPVEGDGGG